MKKAEYKVVASQSGLAELETKVTALLNAGWKPLGGIAFNQGYPYQALARMVVVTATEPEARQQESASNYRSASEAMRLVDELT